jgi:hypothetical protein
MVAYCRIAGYKGIYGRTTTMNKKLIFLDLDGVCNCHDFNMLAQSNIIHQDKIALLNHIITETNAKIVLSSAWRYLIIRKECNLKGMDWLLRSHGLMAGRLIGFTEADTMIDGKPMKDERGKQISSWIEKHKFDGKYVVLDDGGTDDEGVWTDLGINTAGHPTVWTKSNIGLTKELAEEAINLL